MTTTPELTPDGAWPELPWRFDGCLYVADIQAGVQTIRVIVSQRRPNDWRADLSGGLMLSGASRGATPAEALAPVRAELRRIIAALTEAAP